MKLSFEKCIRFVFEDEVTGKYVGKNTECLGPGNTATFDIDGEEVTVDVTCEDKFLFGFGQKGDPKQGSGLRVREYQINYGDFCCFGPPDPDVPTPPTPVPPTPRPTRAPGKGGKGGTSY